MSQYDRDTDSSLLALDDSGNVKQTYQENMVILDLPDINGISVKRRKEIIEELNKLLEEDETQNNETPSFSDKIKFILDRSRGEITLPSKVEVVTRTNNVIVSKSDYQVDGDITSIVTDSMPKNNRDFLYQVHLLAIKLYMKKWRNNIIGVVEKVRIILGWLNRLQAYASLISITIFLLGLLTGETNVMLVSFLPLIATGIISMIKRQIR